MRIYLGGHLNFYHPERGKWLEIELGEEKSLVEVIAGTDIAIGEVHLVVVNGEAVGLDGLMVRDGDEVKLYSAAGGG